MNKIINHSMNLGIAFLLIKIKPLDSYSYFIGLLTVVIWITIDLFFKRLGE